MHNPGVGDMRLWLGDENAVDELRTQYALVHLAAFLAQSMKETIKYDACDENKNCAQRAMLLLKEWVQSIVRVVKVFHCHCCKQRQQ